MPEPAPGALQLPLGLSLPETARFDNFLAGPNREAVHELARLVHGGTGVLYLWGPPGSGRTHLLQAACHAAGEAGHAVAYLPLAEVDTFEPVVLEGMAQMALVCVDDIQGMAGRTDWEEALFHCFNQVQAAGRSLVFAADSPPEGLPLGLADLRSRLGSGLVYGLRPLSDEERCEALRLHAQARGLELPVETARYLLNHFPRDLPTLYRLLDQLDAASLAAQRRLTIPFVKEALCEE